jgi:type III restriction enzyme
MITSALRENHEHHDFAVPFILREQEEQITTADLDVATLPPFDDMSLAQLKNLIGQQDVFRSQDMQTGTQFGDYRVDGGVMTATGYNDFLARITRRIAESLGAPVTKSSRDFANITKFPFLQVDRPRLSAWVDDYIRRRLFAEELNPLADENWRLLCIDAVAGHIIRVFGRKLPELTATETTAPARIGHRRLSEVPALRVRESSSIETPKCIYERLPYPSRNGGFELAFIKLAIADASVAAFCKVNEQKHTFMRLRYVRENGLPGFYSPDFLVRTATGNWLVETKAQDQLAHPDVIRKKTAAAAWCRTLNQLPPAELDNREWNYCLLGEAVFAEFTRKNASMEEILNFTRIRPEARAAGVLF